MTEHYIGRRQGEQRRAQNSQTEASLVRGRTRL